MKPNFRYKRSALVIGMTGLVVFILVRCSGKDNKEQPYADARKFENYAGSAKCGTCHKEIYENHIRTAHYLTGQPAIDKFLKGSFEEGTNVFHYTPDLQVRMEKRDSGYYQHIFYQGEDKMSLRFDIVIGSGVMGQSYLNWRNGRLFQMPITFFTAANQWSTSPGFPEKRVMIDRPITSRCLECHACFAQGVGGTEMEPESFDPKKIIYGVTCEKCHGPGAMHVKFHEENPGEKKGKYITNPAALSRIQQLDACALCHSGKWEKSKPSFSFKPGDKLTDYFVPKEFDDKALSANDAEVHGNQYGLLHASQCFKNSDMTCNTCHNTHVNQRGATEMFSSRCITCHDTKADNFRTPAHRQATNIQKNCIDCHMPLRPSNIITVKLEGQDKNVASLIRSHYIAIYPDSVLKYTHLNKSSQ